MSKYVKFVPILGKLSKKTLRLKAHGLYQRPSGTSHRASSRPPRRGRVASSRPPRRGRAESAGRPAMQDYLIKQQTLPRSSPSSRSASRCRALGSGACGPPRRSSSMRCRRSTTRTPTTSRRRAHGQRGPAHWAGGWACIMSRGTEHRLSTRQACGTGAGLGTESPHRLARGLGTESPHRLRDWKGLGTGSLGTEWDWTRTVYSALFYTSGLKLTEY